MFDTMSLIKSNTNLAKVLPIQGWLFKSPNFTYIIKCLNTVFGRCNFNISLFYSLYF